MKQLLAAGYGNIYQICKVFRDGERGPQHLREFTLVEWYRLGFGLREIMGDTIGFIAALLDRTTGTRGSISSWRKRSCRSWQQTR